MTGANCQFCGAQTTTIEHYYQWVVCTACAVKLKPSTTRTEEAGRHARRKRCALCRELCYPNAGHAFFGHLDPELHNRCWNKFICTDCEPWLRSACFDCGRTGAGWVLYGASPPRGYCTPCYHRWGERMQEEWRQRHMVARMTHMQRHARILSDYAGEHLEWPCTVDALKRIWRQAARRTHPDTGGDAAAFRTAHESYAEVLSFAEGGAR
jgi:hypothetical protein